MADKKAMCLIDGCEIPIAQPGKDVKQDIVQAHYRREHDISIYSRCSRCNEWFIAILTPSFEGVRSDFGREDVMYREICDDCVVDDPLKKLYVRDTPREDVED